MTQILIVGPYVMANGNATVAQQSEFCAYHPRRRRTLAMAQQRLGATNHGELGQAGNH